MGFNEDIGKARMKDDYPGNKSDSINQDSSMPRKTCPLWKRKVMKMAVLT